MTNIYTDGSISLPTEAEISAAVNSAKKKAAEPTDKKTLKTIFSLLDLTTLNSTDWFANVEGMISRVNGFRSSYPEMENVGGVCLFPNFIPAAKKLLTDKSVKIATVSASFPTSQTFRDIKIAESKAVAGAGADELDIVISVGAFLSREYGFVSADIAEIKEAIGEARLKVILETGLLKEPEHIFRASLLAMEAGADFIKTSTGKSEVSATPEAAYIMCRAIAEYYGRTGIRAGFKPAGGVATTADALLYYHIVRDTLGDEWINPALFRIGASRLANNLLADIYPERKPYF